MMITANNGFIEQSERYAFNNAGESLKKYILLKKGELAYNHGASKLRPYGSCFALTTAENARIPFVYHCFSAENQNAEFMSIELNGAEIENQLRKIVSSGARMDGLLNISFDEYTSVSVLLPGTEEQDRIADFFRHLDNLITLHQRKFEKLTNVKKSMLEKMFPQNGSSYPEIRFKGFTDPWEQRKLGDVVKEIIRNDPESEAPIMMITANNGFIEQSERYAFNNAGESLKKYILLKKGELAYNHGASKLRPYGSCFALTTAENARIPFVYHCFSAENQNAEFMSIELNGAEIENQLRKIVSSGARMDGLLNISFDEYTSVSVLLPGTEEQDRIADFFRHLDNLITLHQRECISFTGRADRLILTANKKRTTSSWEQRKFSDITFPAGEKNKDNLPLESYSITNEHGFVPQDEKFENGGTMREADKRMYYIVSPNSFAYNPARINVGSIGYQNIGKNVIVSSLYEVFKTSEDVDDRLLWHWFKSSDFQKLIMQLQEGGVRLYFYYDKLCMGEVSLPSLDEQRKIGKLFDTLDNLITLHQRKGKAAVSGCFLNCSSLEKSSAQSRTLELFGQTSNQEIKYIIDGLSILGGKLRNFCVKLIILLSYTRINDIAKYHISRNTECVHNIN